MDYEEYERLQVVCDLEELLQTMQNNAIEEARNK